MPHAEHTQKCEYHIGVSFKRHTSSQFIYLDFISSNGSIESGERSHRASAYYNDLVRHG